MKVAPREYWLGFPNFGTKLVLRDLLKFHFGKSSYFSSDGNMGRGRLLQEEKLNLFINSGGCLYLYLFVFLYFYLIYIRIYICVCICVFVSGSCLLQEEKLNLYFNLDVNWCVVGGGCPPPCQTKKENEDRTAGCTMHLFWGVTKNEGGGGHKKKHQYCQCPDTLIHHQHPPYHWCVKEADIIFIAIIHIIVIIVIITIIIILCVRRETGTG